MKRTSWKRITAALLAFALTLTLLPAEAVAAEIGGSPEDPPSVTASDPDGGIQVYAAGTITEHTLDNGVVLKFDADTGTITDCILNGATSVDVPAELGGVAVTALGDRSFEELYTLESVSLPDTIESIGNSAFSNAKALTAIAIPDSVTLIDELAFNRCEKLASVTFGENSRLEHIGAQAFFMCGFSAFEIPQSVKQLDNDIFYQCSKLESIVIPETVETINSDGWFQNCYKLSHIVLPSHMTELGARIFRGCSSLTKENVNIPEGITYIGDEAFMGCTKFDSITIPEKVTYIGEGAFRSCTGLTEIVIPENVTTLGNRVFIYSNNLKKIEILGPVTELGDESFSDCRSLTDLTLPDTLKTIGKQAFIGCNTLTNVDLPEGLETIGENAFQFCNKLTELTLPASVLTVGNSAISGYDYNSLNTLTVLGTGTTFEEGNLAYVPDGFVMYGHTGSPAEAYAAEKQLTFIPLDQMNRTLSVKVTTPDGAVLSEDFTVTWYDEDGNKAGEGATLTNVDAAKSYAVQVTLTDTLAAQYAQPERKTFLPEDPAEWVCQLVPLDTVTVTGRVVGKNQTALAGATVTIAQNGVEQSAITAADGTFRLTSVEAVVTLVVGADGYYTRRFTVDLSQQTELGDIALTELVTDQLVVTVNVTPAALEGENPAPVELSSLEGLAFTVTKGGVPVDFEALGTSLVFAPDSVAAGDVVTVTVADTRGKYAAPDPVAVTLDGGKIGYCQLDLTEKGGIRLGALSGQAARLMVFDAGGKCVFTGEAAAYQTVSALDAGTYTVVLMAQNPLISGVPSLAQLAAFGLTRGTDYFQASAAVTDGKIAQVADTTVPALDMGKLSVTKSASVKTNKPDGMIPGESFLVRADFVLDEAKQGEAQALELIVPDGILVTGSVALVDNVPVTFSTSGKTASVPVSGKTSAVVYLYCQAGRDTGIFNISAALRLSGGGSQPIGTAVARVENARIDVPEKTGRTTITASGKGAAGSDVAVYANGVQIAETTINAIGKWTAELDLTKAGKVYSYSYHDIYAVIGTGEEALTTDTATVLYDSRVVTLKSLTFATNFQRKVLYFTGGMVDAGDGVATGRSTNNPTYYYFSVSQPNFSFKVEFEGDAGLKEVYVLTKNHAGEATYVPAVYDETQNAWLATHDYQSAYESPALFGVAYTPEDLPVPPADSEMWTEFYQDMRNVSPDEYDLVKSVFDTEMPVSVEDGELTISYDNKEITLGTVLSDTASLSGTAAELEEQGYVRMEEGKYVRLSGDGGSNIYVAVADTGTGELEIETIRLNQLAGNTEGQAVQGAGTVQSAARDASLGDVTGLIDTLVQNLPDDDGYLKRQKGTVGMINKVVTLQEIRSHLDDLTDLRSKYYRKLSQKVSEVQGMLDAESCKGNPLLTDQQKEEFRAQFPELRTNPRDPLKPYKLESFGVACRVATYNVYLAAEVLLQKVNPAGLVQQLGANMAASALLGYVYDIVTKFINHRYEVITKYYDDLAARIKAAYSHDDDGECEPEPDPEIESPMIEVPDIEDPSGYVYEAVPSNRLEGVTATIYQKNQSGTMSQWDTQPYDQVNPQTTAEDGCFQWDVPAGSWQVTFSKEGYEDADTSRVSGVDSDGWLPVPPPQIGKNVAMIATAAPEVISAIAFEEQAEVVFSQYMDIESVKAALALEGFNAEDIEVEALDPEYDMAGTTQYATRFAVKLKDGSRLIAPVTVTAGTGAKSYNGKTIGSAYTSEAMTPIQRPTGIAAPESVQAVIHEPAGISVVLAPGLAGRELKVENLTPALMSVSPETVTTGADGSAAVTVTGSLPGVGRIRVTDPASGLSTVITVNIATSERSAAAPQPVTARLADGTMVTSGMSLPRGTRIYLTTPTAGAEIRYTVNDTCPCTEDALVYSDFVVITGDMVLRAAAVKDGQYSASPNLRLELKVQSDGPEGGVPGVPGVASGGNSVGSSGSASYSVTVPSAVAHGTVTATPKEAVKGAVVTVTAIPDEGYQLSELTVTDSRGQEIELTVRGGGKYVFTMPDTAVRIEAVFVPAAEDSEGTDAGLPFADVAAGAWYYDAAEYVFRKGMMLGDGSDTRFNPEGTVTRAMIVTILHRLEGEPFAQVAAFTDVPEGQWYTLSVAWAAANGIVEGYGDGKFAPNDAITREQLAAILYRYADWKGYDVSARANLSVYLDAGQISSYAAEPMQWANARALVTGLDSNTLAPKGNATRAQAAAILMRFCERTAE